MKIPNIPLAQTIIQLCKAKNIMHIVISPGSRNAPLTIGFTNDPFFKCYSIIDERCAAFFALGIAQQIKHPVAVVCTSGSALLNYFPAVAEAFYSDIPLVVLSADRPEHLVGIGDGQTINQKNVYGTHVLHSSNLKPEGLKENAAEINTALNTCITSSGPVHINCPFDEPLYEMVDNYSVEVKSNKPLIAEKTVGIEELDTCVSAWNSAKRKMILVGVNAPNQIDQKLLDQIADDNSVIVFTETTSNLHHKSFFNSIDKIIIPLEEDGLKKLQPDLLVTIGGMIVSKKIKAFLRNYQPQQHWHVDKKKANDTFFCLNKHIKGIPNWFFSELLKNAKTSDSNYYDYWEGIKQIRLEKHETYLKTVPFSDFTVFNSILKSIPNRVQLHLGNSSTIRYTQLFDFNPSLKVFCNRGTSGIDGSMSTAIGAASISEKQTVFITGDLSFFYDSNALWNNYTPSNFRIIVVNNGGGGIFRILPGHKNTDNFDNYFETTHNYSAKNLCNMYGFEYTSAEAQDELDTKLEGFYATSNQPKLLEIFTPRMINDAVLLNYFKAIK